MGLTRSFAPNPAIPQSTRTIHGRSDGAHKDFCPESSCTYPRELLVCANPRRSPAPPSHRPVQGPQIPVSRNTPVQSTVDLMAHRRSFALNLNVHTPENSLCAPTHGGAPPSPLIARFRDFLGTNIGTNIKLFYTNLIRNLR